MHKLHYRIKNILPCKTGRILLVFNPIVSVVFTATAFLTPKGNATFRLLQSVERQTVRWFYSKILFNKKGNATKSCIAFSNAFTHTNQTVAFVLRAPLSVETPARMPKFATLTPW